MKLSKLASMIDSYTTVNTISVLLNGNVLSMGNRETFYIDITSDLEEVEVKEHFLDAVADIYTIILDVDSFKTVFKI